MALISKRVLMVAGRGDSPTLEGRLQLGSLLRPIEPYGPYQGMRC